MGYRFLSSSILGREVYDGPVKIAGAGIAGLLAAYFLKKKGMEVRIFEASNQPGGLIQTTETEWAFVEEAANGFLWCPELAEISSDLGLNMIRNGEEARKKYFVKNKRLKRMPVGLADVTAAVYKLLKPQKGVAETVEQFANQYLGKAVAANLLNPALGGIYAAHISDLSFPLTMPDFARVQQEGGSFVPKMIKSRKSAAKTKPVTQKRGGTHSYASGLQALTNGLAAFLKEEIQYNHPVSSGEVKDGQWLITAPAYASAHLVRGQLKELLEEVQYIPLASVSFIFSKNGIDKLKPGFGAVVGPEEGLKTIGLLFNHHIFPQQMKEDVVCIRCIVRDEYRSDPEFIDKPEQEILELALQELYEIFDVKEKPLWSSVKAYPRAIPLYSPAHYHRLFEVDELLKSRYPNIRFFGNWTGKISIRGMAEEAGKL